MLVHHKFAQLCWHWFQWWGVVNEATIVNESVKNLNVCIACACMQCTCSAKILLDYNGMHPYVKKCIFLSTYTFFKKILQVISD